MPAGRGLFGGATPYPVSPQVQQGLMGDAWRQFGAALLSQAQNPNLSQGLAGALAAGRQAYGQGAEQAYQVGREQEQDAAQREYREQQAQYYKSRAETEAAKAKAERQALQSEAERLDAIKVRIKNNPFLAPAQKEAALTRLQMGESATESMLLPEQDPEMTPYQREQVRLAEERLGLQQSRGGAQPKSGAPDKAAIFRRIAQLVNDGMSPEKAQRVVMDELAAAGAAARGEAPPSPPPASLLQQIEQGYVGGEPGAPAPTPPDSREQPQTGSSEAVAIESIVRDNPQLAQGVQTMIDRGSAPEEILKKLESMGYGGE